MPDVASALNDAHSVDSARTVVPVSVEGTRTAGAELANELFGMRGGIGGALGEVCCFSDAQTKELRRWYSFVQAHPRNPWIALDARLQEKLAISYSAEKSEFAKRCYNELVEPFDFDLHYALINMAIMSDDDDDVLGRRAYDKHDLEVPDWLKMIAGTEIYRYGKPGSLFTDHVERVTVYKSGDEARLVEERSMRTLQEIFEAHCKGDASNHWSCQYASRFSRGCPRCGAKCWLYGPCAACFAECEERWHVTRGSSSEEHKLELERCLMRERGIGKRARDKILQSGLTEEGRWQVRGRTVYLANALKRVSAHVAVPQRFRYRLIRRFVDHLLGSGEDGRRRESAVLALALDAAALPTDCGGVGSNRGSGMLAASDASSSAKADGAEKAATQRVGKTGAAQSDASGARCVIENT